MKLVKTASGKTTIKMSKKEWTDLGKQAGWIKEASNWDAINQEFSQSVQKSIENLNYVQDRISKGVLSRQEENWIYELGKQIGEINRQTSDIATSLSG